MESKRISSDRKRKERNIFRENELFKNRTGQIHVDDDDGDEAEVVVMKTARKG
jgi:hypothetical protein